MIVNTVVPGEALAAAMLRGEIAAPEFVPLGTLLGVAEGAVAAGTVCEGVRRVAGGCSGDGNGEAVDKGVGKWCGGCATMVVAAAVAVADDALRVAFVAAEEVMIVGCFSERAT